MAGAVISGADSSPPGIRSLEDDLGQPEVHRLPVQRGEGGHPDQGALQLTDVARDPRGDELQYLRRGVQLLLHRLLTEDRDPGLQLGRLDIGSQTPLEAVAQAVLQRHQLLGRPVRGEHDLFVRVVQRIEGVEELLLRRLLARQELDVVDQQDVHVAVALAEGVALPVADRVDELVGELLRAHVPHPGPRVEAPRVVPDRVQQVGLAEPRLPVDEQGVVRLRGRLGDGHGRGVREPVGRPDDEGVEEVLRVQPGVRLAGARREGPAGRPSDRGPSRRCARGRGPDRSGGAAAAAGPAGRGAAARTPGARAAATGSRGPAAAGARCRRARATARPAAPGTARSPGTRRSRGTAHRLAARGPGSRCAAAAARRGLPGYAARRRAPGAAAGSRGRAGRAVGMPSSEGR